MTTENKDIDARVAKAYRDLASETTPPELDRKILSAAAGAVRSRYGRARAWVRPVAWAATIGLSLAFILELSRVPDSVPLSAGGSDGDTFEVLEDSVVSDEAAVRAKSDTAVREERERRSDAPAAKTDSTPPSAAEPALEQDAASVDFDADDISLLKEAEEQARLQSGETRPAARAAGLSALAENTAVADGCDAEARTSAETWYACIESLRELGLSDLAAVELEALREQFPDFKESTPGR